MPDKILLVKLKRVVGFLYIPKGHRAFAVIHAKGGPSLGDEGKSSLWPIAKKHKVILFCPDYIGYCRSDGQFNFKNSVESLRESERFLKGKISASIVETGEKIQLGCTEILLVGSSWGGAIATFIDKYSKSSITNLALCKPVTDWVTQGKTRYKEEDVTNTAKVIHRAYSHIYKGFEKSDWPKIFSGKLSECNPIANVHLVKNKTLYICHGQQDKVINWRKSMAYYNKIKKSFPETKAYIKLITNEGHSSEINALGLEFALANILSKTTTKN